jgi:diguanylate cyclase (GGDEF)-like protein
LSTDRQTHLNLEDFPNSPYAAELRRGVSHRDFAPDIESEYEKRHLDRVHLRVRIWFSLWAVVGVVSPAIHLRAGGWTPALFFEVIVMVPLALGMAAIVWSRLYGRIFMPVVRIYVPVVGALVMYILAERIAGGRPEDVSALVVCMFSAFFFSGLMFGTAVIACAMQLVAFVLGAMVFQMSLNLVGTALVVIVVVGATTAFICRDIEAAYRRNFLEGILIRELVARDGLTGVMNRRAFDEHLLRLWQQGMRDKRKIVLIMIDLDHFKALNDLHGHQGGDAALRRVAQTIQGFARRPLDMAARYGGEEFAVLLYDFAESQVPVFAEQLRRAIENLCIEHGAAVAGPFVTVSIGVGLAEPAIGRTPQGAIQLADEALYEAKHRGRNRFVIRGADEHRSLNTGSFNAPLGSYQTRSSGTT